MIWRDKNESINYGAIIDIGSGSIGVAIISSAPNKQKPEIIWSSRDWIPAGKRKTSEKQILARLMESVLDLSVTGVKELSKHNKNAKIKYVNVAVSAPWSYTISRTARLVQEEPFVVTKHLIKEVKEQAKRKAGEYLNDEELSEKLDLTVLHSYTTQVRENGYLVKNPIGKSVTSLVLTEVASLVSTRMLNNIEDLVEKSFPESSIHVDTFMSNYFSALSASQTEFSNSCLIDVTAESVELGVVHDGLLSTVCSVEAGRNALVRDLVDKLSLQSEEVNSLIKESDIDIEKLSKKKKEEFQLIKAEYGKKIESLFNKAGSALAIPKTVFLHTDPKTEAFFLEAFKQAIQQVTGYDHKFHLITVKTLNNTSVNDSAIALLALVFHSHSKL